MEPVKLSLLVEALEFDSNEFSTFIDLQSKKVWTVEDELLRQAESGEEDVSDLISADEAGGDSEFAIAKAIATDDGKRFVPAPSKYDFHEYRQMERFIRTVDDDSAAEELWRAIKGQGAFRYFKDTAHRLGLLDKWFAFRDAAMKEFVQDWAEANEISFIDDTAQTPEP